jgi:two-component system OmpR family response regulator
VLEYLLAKAGRVVSKDQIIEAIASWDEELTPNAVEVYVSRVRAKLEASGVKIRTVRGFGYIVEAPDGRT